MPDEFSINLCELVQRRPEIYDILNKNYHNEEAKNNAWEAIAKQLGVPKSKCVIKWKSLKHQFIKAKKEQNTQWDMWPWLQFCDDTTAVKGGSRKRKRESTATPVQTAIAADGPATEPSTFSKSPQRGKAKKATTTATLSTRAGVATTQSSQQSFLSQIPLENWRFPRSSSFGAGAAATQSPQESFLSQIPLEHWRTQASPSVPQFSNKSPEPAVEPASTGRPTSRRTTRVSFGGTLDSSSIGPTLAKPQQAFPSAPLAQSSRLAYDGNSTILSVTGQKEATDIAVIQESPKKNTASPAPSRQQLTASRTPRGRRSTARTVLAETVLEEQIDNSDVEGLQPQQASKESLEKDVQASPSHSKQRGVASRTPRGRRSTMRPVVAPEVIQEEDQAANLNGEDPQPKRPSKKSPKRDVAESPPQRSRQQATASRTPQVNKDSPEKAVTGSLLPRSRQQAASSRTPQVSKDSPEKNAAESPPRSRQQATASKTPRGRRSTARPNLAEVVSEEQQVGSSRDEEPKLKRARIEGNGLGADNQADTLMDVEFDTALDKKFFKRLQEKFAKLRPEVVSTMKANIFRMLDEAAED